MIALVVIVALAVGFVSGSITGYALGFVAARRYELADIRPALRRGKRK